MVKDTESVIFIPLSHGGYAVVKQGSIEEGDHFVLLPVVDKDPVRIKFSRILTATAKQVVVIRRFSDSVEFPYEEIVNEPPDGAIVAGPPYQAYLR